MQAIDNALLRLAVRAGAEVPGVFPAARILTEFGGSAWLVPLSMVAAAFLATRDHRRRAFALLLVTLGGRVIVELLKWLVARPRPALVDYDITVHSLSFPSGHAANSMIVYLTLALIAAPVLTRRSWPVPASLLAAALIGCTRPVLSVHWPTDILAGWALGLAWTLSCVWLLQRWMRGDLATAPRPLSR